MHPIANPTGAWGIGVRGYRLDPAFVAVLLDPEVRRDIVLVDRQALLAKTGEKVEFEEPGGEIVGLKIVDEIGIGIRKREITFSDGHQGRQVTDRARQQVKLRAGPARSDLQQERPSSGAWRQGFGWIAAPHADAEVIESGLGGGPDAVLVDLDPAVIDAPSQRQAGEGALFRIV